jgi:hypothetical protein
MMAVVLKLAGMMFANRVTTGITCALMLIGAAFAWHKLDKSSALRQAVVGYVAQAELDAATAQINEANRRAQIAEEAADRLLVRVRDAEAASLQHQQEIDSYVSQNDIPSRCVASDPIFDLLRGK